MEDFNMLSVRTRFVLSVFLLIVLPSLMLFSCLDTGILKGKSKPPATSAHPPGKFYKGAPLYLISAATSNTIVPGMDDDKGFMGEIFSKIGAAAGAPVGPQRTLRLELNSAPPPSTGPEAAHNIPSGMNMGSSLPLAPPSKTAGTSPAGAPGPPKLEKMEPPQFRIKFYWGCGKSVRHGQPRIVDTANINKADFSKKLFGRGAEMQNFPRPKDGYVYALWPNELDDQKVPIDGSLQGAHFVHGNYIPHIKFNMDSRHDFMSPVRFSVVEGTVTESIRIQWEAIPNAIGYFGLATAMNQDTGEMIVWSTSEVFEPGWGLLDYLPSSDVRKYIEEKAILPPSVTSCEIPAGIFAGTDAAMLQFIAYGEDFYMSYPPRPANAPKSWKPDWTVKARFKSTGMLMLGVEEKEGGEESTLDKIKGIFGD